MKKIMTIEELEIENKELKKDIRLLLDRHESIMKVIRYMQKVLHGEA